MLQMMSRSLTIYPMGRSKTKQRKLITKECHHKELLFEYNQHQDNQQIKI